jgi:glycosyltransferase involved in cell wall biosynthesis
MPASETTQALLGPRGTLAASTDDTTVRLSVLHVLAPAEFGGLESVVRLMSAGQRRNGHDVSVGLILTHRDGARPWEAALRTAGVDVVPIVSPGRSYARQYRAVAELCRRRRPSVVHTHGYRADIVAGLAARRMGIPTVTTVHGFTGGGRKNQFYEWLQRRAFRRFSAVMPVSRPMAGELRERGTPPHRLHVVPNAFAPGLEQLSRTEARARLGLGAGAHVGWVGRLSAEKGPDVMIRALARLGVDVRLSVIGGGPERPALQRLAENLGVNARVTWHGVVSDAARLLTAFDVVALSSRTEGTPIVLLEAIAACVPVVATRVGGIPDVIGDGEALLVEPDDPAALAAGVAATIGDSEAAASRATAARRQVADRFAVAPWLARIDAVYAAAGAREASGGETSTTLRI